MRIVEIRITEDLARLRRKKYPEALYGTRPVPPWHPYYKRGLRPLSNFDDTDLAPVKIRRIYPVALVPATPKFSSGASFIGQGVLEATGILYNFAACVLDAIVLEYLTPRCNVPQVLMPIAYITAINMPSDSVGCTGTTTTIPATGALQTLVDGNAGPIYG
jgi:hypothetical protein